MTDGRGGMYTFIKSSPQTVSKSFPTYSSRFTSSISGFHLDNASFVNKNPIDGHPRRRIIFTRPCLLKKPTSRLASSFFPSFIKLPTSFLLELRSYSPISYRLFAERKPLFNIVSFWAYSITSPVETSSFLTTTSKPSTTVRHKKSEPSMGWSSPMRTTEAQYSFLPFSENVNILLLSSISSFYRIG